MECAKFMKEIDSRENPQEKDYQELKIYIIDGLRCKQLDDYILKYPETLNNGYWDDLINEKSDDFAYSYIRTIFEAYTKGKYVLKNLFQYQKDNLVSKKSAQQSNIAQNYNGASQSEYNYIKKDYEIKPGSATTI